MNDDELLDALGIEFAPLKTASRTPREERILAAFEDILRFYQVNGRVPSHGEGRDIFERIYAARLDQLRRLPDVQDLLAPLDQAGLLTSTASQLDVDSLDEDALLAELGVDSQVGLEDDITVLRHVRSYGEIKAAEEVANRIPCEDFSNFSHLFDVVHEGLKTGNWMTKPFIKNASIELGDFFIIGGQLCYVAEMHAGALTKDGRENPRLRVIFDNHTESDLLLRSLSRSLYPDGDTPVGQRVIKKDDGPLFRNAVEVDDIESGTIYVLRSFSAHPFVVKHRELVHKIGVTGGKVEVRVAAAEKDPTYLLAAVEIVASYKLHNINRTMMENIFHRLFGAVQLDLTIEDRFGNPVKPKEWFFVPLNVIDDAVGRIIDGTITQVTYDPSEARLVHHL